MSTFPAGAQVFKYFETTPEAQSRALSYGLYGAAGMRLALILAGSAAVEHFRPVLLVFAAILLFSSYKLLTEEEEEDEDLSDNALVNLCKKFITVSDDYDGDKFFTLKDGVRRAGGRGPSSTRAGARRKPPGARLTGSTGGCTGNNQPTLHASPPSSFPHDAHRADSRFICR